MKVFNYIDYRKFLGDYYALQKEERSHFSYRYFAQKAGIKSPVYFKEIADGKKNLSRKMIEKFSTALKLSNNERVYFRHLVLFNQAKTVHEKQEHYLVLKEMVGMINQHTLNTDYFDYFDKWYTPVIRELISQKNWNDNYQELAETVFPPIKPKQVKEAIALLKRLGFVKKQSNGIYEHTHKDITTGPEVASLAIRSFNKQILELASSALDTFPREERYTKGITMGISSECYDILVAEIEAFKDRIIKIVDSFENPDDVYQIYIQLFPLIKSASRKGRKHE